MIAIAIATIRRNMHSFDIAISTRGFISHPRESAVEAEENADYRGADDG